MFCFLINKYNTCVFDSHADERSIYRIYLGQRSEREKRANRLEFEERWTSCMYTCIVEGRTEMTDVVRNCCIGKDCRKSVTSLFFFVFYFLLLLANDVHWYYNDFAPNPHLTSYNWWSFVFFLFFLSSIYIDLYNV